MNQDVNVCTCKSLSLLLQALACTVKLCSCAYLGLLAYGLVTAASAALQSIGVYWLVRDLMLYTSDNLTTNCSKSAGKH